jgi:hypothetical protein
MTNSKENGQLSSDDKVVVTKDQVSCEMGDDVVILNLTEGEYFELSGVGVRIWEMIQQPCRLGDIETSLQEHYCVAPEVLRTDIDELIQNMIVKGLARIEP